MYSEQTVSFFAIDLDSQADVVARFDEACIALSKVHKFSSWSYGEGKATFTDNGKKLFIQAQYNRFFAFGLDFDAWAEFHPILKKTAIAFVDLLGVAKFRRLGQKFWGSRSTKMSHKELSELFFKAFASDAVTIDGLCSSADDGAIEIYTHYGSSQARIHVSPQSREQTILVAHEITKAHFPSLFDRDLQVDMSMPEWLRGFPKDPSFLMVDVDFGRKNTTAEALDSFLNDTLIGWNRISAKVLQLVTGLIT